MRKFYIGRRDFLRTAAAAAGVLATGGRALADGQPGTTIWNGATDTRATLAVADPSRIKVLQFTDLHFFNGSPISGRDKRTLRELPQYIELTQPDLVVVSGDMWHDNPDGRGFAYMQKSVERISSLGVPWVYVWGNHDQMDDFNLGHEHITKAKHSLYRGGAGGGNYSLELTGKDRTPLWQMVCLNSTREGLGKAQHDWLAASSLPKLPSFVVAHIPLKQQGDALVAKTASGVGLETTCNEREDGSTLTAIKGACDARAFFCGHDHVNDYSIQIDGIELVYGRATGWSGYGGDDIPKGAKLYTANAQSGSYAWETVFPDGTRWQPTPGKTIDKVIDAPWDTLERRQARKAQKGNA